MQKLTKYLIDNSERLIGVSIRPSEEVLSRGDAPLYIWRKMCMSHDILKGCCEDDEWRSVAPAAHLYPLGIEELDILKPYINKLHVELNHALGTVGNSLWYLVKSDGGWALYSDENYLGSVSLEGAKEVEYATDADTALVNLLLCMAKIFESAVDLATCIVLPFGCQDTSVWKYSRMVVLLGSKEYDDFKSCIVSPYAEGVPTMDFTPDW